jgi:serine/threonine-protein kinase
MRGGPSSRSPQIQTGAADFVDVESEPGSVLPGHASADLDWDDEEESTNVFGRDDDLFGELHGKKRTYDEADSTARRDVSMAAGLIASSGRAARPMPSTPPVPQTARSARPALEDMDDDEVTAVPQARRGRAPHPSWHPQQPGMAAREGGNSTKVLLIVAVLAVLAGAFFWWRSNADGTLSIRVAHDGNPVDKADVYVDGRQECRFASPCTVSVKPGDHDIRVTSGNLAGKQQVAVKGGKELEVIIPLGKPTEDAKPAGLKLASALKGVKVFVNGKDKGELPLELKELEAGKVELRFVGGDEYGNLEKTVELKAGETVSLDDIKLPLLKVKVTFVLATEGAKVELLKGSQSTALPFKGNQAEQTLDTKESWTVKASAKGYKDFEQKIEFSEKAELTFTILLDKEEEVASAAPPPSTATPAPPSTVAVAPPPKAPPPPKDEPAAGGKGTLNANSIPPSKVIIDGRPRGSTPVTGVSVSPGTHSVVFIHKKYGRKSRTVTVGAGQTKTATVRFKKRD